jgi:DNA-binding transcriptional ArsR family regulator
MVVRTPHGEVRFKVQRNALLLGEFTIAQLVHATGLNPESVRTEIQRLKKEGFVISERQAGQHEALYRLSDDLEKRLTLSRSVRAFYPAPSEPVPPRPTSRLYHAALRTLDQAERKSGDERKALLEEAAHQLEGAWQTEGASRAPELVKAHLWREQGRLKCLQGQREEAQKLFKQAREKFAAADLESETRLIDEYLLYIEVRIRIDAENIQDTDPTAKIQCVLKVLEDREYPPVSPLLHYLAELTGSLVQTAGSRVNEWALAAGAHVTAAERHFEEIIHEEFRRLEYKLLSRPPTALERLGEEGRPDILIERLTNEIWRELLIAPTKQSQGEN